MERDSLHHSVTCTPSVYMSRMPTTHHRLVRASGGDSDVYGAAEDSVSDSLSDPDSESHSFLDRVIWMEVLLWLTPSSDWGVQITMA